MQSCEESQAKSAIAKEIAVWPRTYSHGGIDLGLSGCRILVTGGPTRAYLDAVRFISNESTGRTGALIAARAAERGAEVLYVRGCGSFPPAEPRGDAAGPLRVVEIQTVEQLVALVDREIGGGGYRAMIHSMAVLDFAPAAVRQGKVSSRCEEWVVRLVPTPKVIERIKRLDPTIFLVGFKLEAALDEAGLVAAARAARRRSGADLIVANAWESVRSGEHRACLVANEASPVEWVMGREAIAVRILDKVQSALVPQSGRRQDRE